MNASSCRNKSALTREISSQLLSLSLNSFMGDKKGSVSDWQGHAVIMDEVDGMDGNADRGGISVSSLLCYTHLI